MQTYRIDLEVPSGFVSPWQADTLFGHLCWVAERHDRFHNFRGAIGLIDLFRSGKPPFILSDGFPSGLLPAPLTLKHLYQPKKSEELDRSRYTALKRAKKREYLTIAQFQAFQKGETPDLTEEPQGFIPSVTLHNQINRFTNTTGDQGNLFELDEWFAPQSEVQIYAKVSSGFADDLKRLFDILTQGGFGAKKSTGKGGCTLSSFVPDTDLEREDIAQPANGFVTISHFVPAQDDPIVGTYKTRIKYGKLGEERTFCGNPFKKPFIMMRPGAVFQTTTVRPWYGRLLENIAYAEHQADVVQYAYAFAVPVLLQ
jgi:CRISPR-associated protein Csm4